MFFKLYPFLKIFAFGSKRGDEPRVAVLGTAFVALCLIMIGNLDVVAPIISAFFCMSYAMVNFTCFALIATGAPNFRPAFKYYNRYVSFFGFILNIGVLFFLNWIYGLVGLGLLGLLYLYLSVYGPEANWGAVGQVLLFGQIRKYLLQLDTGTQHAKFWRPHLLLLVENPIPGLIGFCNSLKKGGLFVLGQVVVGDIDDKAEYARRVRQALYALLRSAQLKAFPQVSINASGRDGFSTLMQCSGLGGMVVNTVVVPFMTPEEFATQPPPNRDATYYADMEDRIHHYCDRHPSLSPDDVHAADPVNYDPALPLQSVAEYGAVLRDALSLQLNVLLTRNFGAGVRGRKQRIYSDIARHPVLYVDVYIIGDIFSDAPDSAVALWGISRHAPSASGSSGVRFSLSKMQHNMGSFDTESAWSAVLPRVIEKENNRRRRMRRK